VLHDLQGLGGLTTIMGHLSDTWDTGLIRHDGVVYVLSDLATQREIICVNHDNSWKGGYFR
jgi:hypothetical protein